jgi:RimJ/RimL family protein N-acetyltransferase
MGLEIGWTWYSPNVWGTRVNPEAKLLLLQHAFEDWGAIRVQLKTDHENKHSQNAIKKLGAKFEGKLRNHMIRRDKTIRHSMMYSITREDWPVVRAKLRERLEHSKDLPELSLDESRYF